MVGQIYLGTIAASAGMAAAGEIIMRCKLKRDGYVPKKVEYKDVNVMGATLITSTLVIPGLNLLYGGYTLLYDLKCYNHYKKFMLDRNQLVHINEKVKKIDE